MKGLYQKLTEYAKGDTYPFHMPGHKRNILDFQMVNPYELDITEIDGFDNLHQKEGILKELTNRIERCYGSEESYLMVNGSTGGILTAISAALCHGEKIIMARNCHMAVYHAVLINELIPVYLYPQRIDNMWMNGPISDEDVDRVLDENRDAKLVVITSPTYEGIVSDITAIAEAVHRHGAALLVDEAHGAHLGFHPYFPESSLKNGADVVIQSLHKTLPAFTQTAVLHRQGERISKDKIRLYASIFQTSSPSYLLMASADLCMEFLEEKNGRFHQYAKLLKDFYIKCSKLRNVAVVGENRIAGTDSEEAKMFQKDPSKLLISCRRAGVGGRIVYDWLRDRYDLQMEMAARDYVIAMTSVCDRKEGFDRLWEALGDIDRRLDASRTRQGSLLDIRCYKEGQWSGNGRRKKDMPLHLPGKYTPYEAQNMGKESVARKDSLGRVGAEYLFLYPPGIPLIVPGEIITEEFLDFLVDSEQEGFEVKGGVDTKLSTISVLL